MQDMQSNLKETGMSGTMYRREDLAGMMDKMKDMVSGGAAQFGAQFGAQPAAQFSEQRALSLCSSPRATRRWVWTARR